MSGSESIGHGLCQINTGLLLKPMFLYRVSKGVTVHVLKNSVTILFLIGTKVVELKDVRMRDGGACPGLVEKSFLPTGVDTKGLRQHLDNHGAVHDLMSRVIEIAGFTLADKLANAIFVRDQFARKFFAHHYLERITTLQVAAKG